MRVVGTLGLVLALTGCKGGGVPGGRSLDKSVESLIPPDTVVLGGVSVKQVMKSPIYQRLAGEKKSLPQLDEFARQTGIDVKRDIDEVVMAFDGKKALVIGRGRIADQAALERALQSKGATKTAVGRYAILTAEGNAVAFVDDRTAIAGGEDRVKSVLSGNAGDDTNRKALLHELAELPEGRHVWAVAVGGFAPMPLPRSGNLANLNRIFASLETAKLSLDLTKGIDLDAIGFCADDKSARQLNDMLRGVIGFGRLSTPSDRPELLKFFDGVKVDQDKKTVKLEAKVPMDMVDYLLKLAGHAE